MPKPIDWLKFSTLLQRAVSDGATFAPPTCEWDVSLHCERPYYVSLETYKPPDAVSPVVTHSSFNVYWLNMATPCRKCQTCLDNRRSLWSRRAVYEIARAPRTWFCTFTISPEWRFRFASRAKSMDYHKSYGEISKEITKYFKRLRKAGFKFRYLLVAEAHKDGYPHLHALIHEVSAPIPKRWLQAEWPYGYTTFKLVEDQRAARYISKYLAKDTRARVRASQHYGLVFEV